jgi:hypothetical protein
MSYVKGGLCGISKPPCGWSWPILLVSITRLDFYVMAIVVCPLVLVTLTMSVIYDLG